MTKQLSTVEKSRVDDLLLSAVDETLRRVFKKEGAKVIWDFMENNYHLNREQIVERPEVFSAGLSRLLVSARPVIEKMILRSLNCKLGLKFEEKEGYEFSDYIKELRERCGC